MENALADEAEARAFRAKVRGADMVKGVMVMGEKGRVSSLKLKRPSFGRDVPQRPPPLRAKARPQAQVGFLARTNPTTLVITSKDTSDQHGLRERQRVKMTPM